MPMKICDGIQRTLRQTVAPITIGVSGHIVVTVVLRAAYRRRYLRNWYGKGSLTSILGCNVKKFELVSVVVQDELSPSSPLPSYGNNPVSPLDECTSVEHPTGGHGRRAGDALRLR